MITIENLKNVLSEIGFEKSDIGDYYKIDYTGCSMAVDFDNAKLIYPEKKVLLSTIGQQVIFLTLRTLWFLNAFVVC